MYPRVTGGRGCGEPWRPGGQAGSLLFLCGGEGRSSHFVCM